MCRPPQLPPDHTEPSSTAVIVGEGVRVHLPNPGRQKRGFSNDSKPSWSGRSAYVSRAHGKSRSPRLDPYAKPWKTIRNPFTNTAGTKRLLVVESFFTMQILKNGVKLFWLTVSWPCAQVQHARSLGCVAFLFSETTRRSLTIHGVSMETSVAYG